jgi:quercetin dioxygenase-like cupin family protein
MKRFQLFGLLCLGAAASVSVATAADRQVQVSAAALRWEKPFGPTGPRRAGVSGDSVNGPYAFMLEMPAGFDTGWHTHDTPYTAVVLSGTVENIEQGESERAAPLAAGSVWSQPAHRNHVTRCQSTSPCLVYISGPGGASFHPMSRDGKALEPAVTK